MVESSWWSARVGILPPAFEPPFCGIEGGASRAIAQPESPECNYNPKKVSLPRRSSVAHFFCHLDRN